MRYRCSARIFNEFTGQNIPFFLVGEFSAQSHDEAIEVFKRKLNEHRLDSRVRIRDSISTEEVR